MGILLMIIGGLAAFIGSIWLLIAAFQESIWWGLGALFLPIVSLIFTIMHWDCAGIPFLLSFVGTIVLYAGAAIEGAV